MQKKPKLLSTGQPSTLKNWLLTATAFFGEQSKAIEFLKKKIAESPHGENEEVIADEAQFIQVLADIHAKNMPTHSEKLQGVMTQIREILEKNDIAGMVFIYDEHLSEYLNHLCTSKSAIKEKDGEIRFTSRLVDFNNDEALQKASIQYSIGMLDHMGRNMVNALQGIQHLLEKVSEHYEIVGSTPVHSYAL